MISRFLFLLPILLGFSILCAQELDVPKAYDAGVKAMDSGNYDAGLAAVDEIIKKHGADGKTRFGSVFGHFYYLKGMLLVQKKEYRKAAENFQICAEKFTNDADTELPNTFQAEALAQWGGCLMALDENAAAAEKYQAALAIQEKYDPKLDRLEAQVNLSKAMMLAGNSGRGKDFISKNLEDPDFPDSMKRSLFLVLMGDWSPAARLREVSTYVDKYRKLMESDTLVNRYKKQNPVYNHLASMAIAAEEPGRAIFWYDLMIDPVEVGKAYAGRIQQLKTQLGKARAQSGAEEFVKQTEAEITELESEIQNQAKQLGDILIGKGSAYYAKGDLEDAKKSFLELLKRFPKHSERAVVMHNLTMCAVNLSQWDDASTYGMQFFREFPDHELRPSMAKVLVDVLFVQGKYEESYRVAGKLLEALTTGTPEADVPAFVEAASLYHLGRYEEAADGLKRYFTDYPDGTRKEAAKYYLGATMVNLQKWDEAVKQLDEFLEEYKVSDIRPSALYFSGLSHMINEDYPIANSRMIELQARHPRAEEVPNSYNILGDILSARGKSYEEITGSYKKALEMVEKEKRGDPGSVAGYALRQLITEANAEQKWDVAVSYYEKFTASYNDSSWRSDVLIAAIEPLVNKGRKDEAQKLLIDFVNEYADQPNSTDLDQMFGTYADFLKQHYTLEEVRKSFQNFPAKTSPAPAALRAWLYMAEIEALTDADAKKYSKENAALFSKLNALYQKNGNDLSNYTLVKLARYNGKNGANEAQARKVYEYILKERPSGEAVGLALIDLAKLEAGKNPSAAKKLFQRVLNEVDDPAAREEAVLGIARAETSAENYAEAQKWWEQYRSNSAWRKSRAEASYGYGVCLLKQGKRDEAAATFVNVYSNFPGQLEWSTKAYIEAAKIIHAKGQELDALKLIREMIQRMGHLEHEGIDEGKKLFFQWKEEYMAKQ